jgi:hypothetical protein
VRVAPECSRPCARQLDAAVVLAPWIQELHDLRLLGRLDRHLRLHDLLGEELLDVRLRATTPAAPRQPILPRPPPVLTVEKQWLHSPPQDRCRRWC